MKPLSQSLRSLSFLLLVSTPAAVACGGATSGSAPETDPSIWTAQSQKLAASRTLGFIKPRDTADPCSASSFTYEAATRMLHGDVCYRGEKILTRDHALSDAEAGELAAVLRSVHEVAVDPKQGCVTDIGSLTVEITDNAGALATFVDDATLCNQPPRPAIAREAGNALIDKLEALALTQAIPTVWSAHTKSITLANREGFAPRPNGTDCLPGNVYRYSAETRVLELFACDGGASQLPQTLTLGQDVAGALVSAFTSLRLATDGEKQCTMDGPSIGVTTTSDEADTLTRYVDSENACDPANPNVIEVGSARAVLAKLAAILPAPKAAPVWGASAKTIAVTASAGFAPQPNGNDCASSTYTYEPAAATLHAVVCDGGKLLPVVDKTLSAAETADVAPFLAALREARSSEKSCWSDAPVLRATVSDSSGLAQSYVDSHNVCNGIADKVWETTTASAFVAKLASLAK